jgi:ribonuclease HII
MANEPRPAPRVVEHIERLRAAGLDTEAFFHALTAIRDDSALSNAHREALYKMIAMESYVWYLEALRGEPVDRFKLLKEAEEVLIRNEAAIKKRSPGDSAAELATKDISKTPDKK